MSTNLNQRIKDRLEDVKKQAADVARYSIPLLITLSTRRSLEENYIELYDLLVEASAWIDEAWIE